MTSPNDFPYAKWDSERCAWFCSECSTVFCDVRSAKHHDHPAPPHPLETLLEKRRKDCENYAENMREQGYYGEALLAQNRGRAYAQAMSDVRDYLHTLPLVNVTFKRVESEEDESK